MSRLCSGHCFIPALQKLENLMEIEVIQYVIKVDVKQSLTTPKHKPQNCTTPIKDFPFGPR